MYRWSLYMVRPEQGLAAHVATGAVPNPYRRCFL